jgi:hypothetical protein
MSAPDWIQAVAESATAIAAFWAFNTWHKQKRGETAHDLAFETLTAVIRATTEVQHAIVYLKRSAAMPDTSERGDAVLEHADRISEASGDVRAAASSVRAFWGPREARLLAEVAFYCRYWAGLLVSYAHHLKHGANVPTREDGALVDEELMAALDGDAKQQKRYRGQLKVLAARIEAWAEQHLRREKRSSWQELKEQESGSGAPRPYKVVFDAAEPDRAMDELMIFLDEDLRQARLERDRRPG